MQTYTHIRRTERDVCIFARAGLTSMLLFLNASVLWQLIVIFVPENPEYFDGHGNLTQHTHKHERTHTNMYMYICIYVCIDMYICVYVFV